MKYITTILFLLLLGISISYWIDYNNLRSEAQSMVLNDALLQKKVKDIRDSAGAQVQVYTAKAITLEQLASSTSAAVKDLQSELMLTRQKLRDVRYHTAVGIETHDTFRIEVEKEIGCTDSGDLSIPFVYEPDSFFRMNGSANFTRKPGVVILKDVSGSYTGKEYLSLTHTEKQRFLSKTQVGFTVKSKNPHSEIRSVQNYTVKLRQPWYKKWYFYAALGAVATATTQHFLK